MTTSRERLRQTLNHIQPDQVVVDMGSTAISGIHAQALSNLREALGLEKRTVKICEPLHLLGEVEEDVRQRLRLDCVDVSSGYNMFGFSNAGRKPWQLQSSLAMDVPTDFNTTVDENGRTYLYPQGERSAWADFADDFGPLTDEQLRFIEEKCDYYDRNTDYGITYSGGIASMGDFAIIPGPNVKHPQGIRSLRAS